MEALVYEDTPLADYFEGEAVPYDLPRDETPPHTPFAPHGLPDLKHRLRDIQRSATSIAPGSAYTDQLLERFRYLIVASQLLTDEARPRSAFNDHAATGSDLTTIRGAILTAVTSFLAAWAIHWLRNRKKTVKSWSWVDLATYLVVIMVLAVAATYFGRRQYTNYLHRASVRTLAKYVDDSHGWDATSGNVIRFIQEVEVVARGYGLGSPLPPITRMEDRQIVRRCQTLRRELGAALKLLTILMADAHQTLQPFVNKLDVQRYHDIYEISLVEYTQAVSVARQDSEDAQQSLKDLRYSVRLHSLARKVFLCDLLALRQTAGWFRCQQWITILHKLREIEVQTVVEKNRLSAALAEEEWGSNQKDGRPVSPMSQTDSDSVPESTNLKIQMRRFDDLAHSIKALNAKMHIVREELNGLKAAKSEDVVIAGALSKHHDTLGTDLQNIVLEWERSKSTMLFAMDTDCERASRSSSGIRTPTSPSSSLGGLQIVDGGPADALRLLNGDSPSTLSKEGFQEEVFEAVASRLPRKRMSLSAMTREEKIMRLAEERKKRATMMEQADNSTSMLRELQMVIKHRPGRSLPSGDTSDSTSNGNRVASL